MIKKVSYLLLTIAAVLTGVSVLLSLVDNTSVSLAGRVMPVNPSSVSAMQLYKGDKVLAAFEKDALGKWKVSVASAGIVRNTADRVAIEELLAFISRAERLPAEGVSFEDSGINSGGAGGRFQFVARVGDESYSVFLGGFSKDGKYRYYSSDENLKRVLQVDRDLTRVFERKGEDFRSLDIVDFASNPPSGIVVYPGDGAQKLVLQSSNIGWVIKEPVSWPASNKAVGRLMRVLSMLRASNISAIDFEVDNSTPYIELINKQGAEKIWLKGKPGDDKAFLKSSERDEIYEVGGAIAWEYLRANAQNYRRRVLDLLDERAVASIRVVDEAGRRVVFSKKQEGGWSAEGDLRFDVDKDSVDSLEKIFKGLVIKDVFAAGSDKALDDKLDKPQMQVQALDAGGAVIAGISLIARPIAPPLRGPDQIFAKVLGRAQIVELEPFSGGYLMRDLKLYRSKVLYFEDFRNIGKIEVITPDFTREYWRNSDTHYQMVKPKTVMLSENGNWEFLSLVRDLARLKCVGYIPEKNMKKMDFGLDRPTLKTILTMRSNRGKNNPAGGKIELIVGKSLVLNDLSGGRGRKTYYYAKLANSEDVFILEKKLIDSLLMEYK